MTLADPLEVLEILKQSYTGNTVIDSDWGLGEAVGFLAQRSVFLQRRHLICPGHRPP